MQFNLFNALSPRGKRIPVTMDVLQNVDPKHNDGEVFFILFFNTTAISKTGAPVTPVILENVTKTNLHSEVKKALAEIGEQIDWGALAEDVAAPTVTESFPKDGMMEVPLYSNVNVSLKDPSPMSGLDFSTLSLKVNGIDVTPQLSIQGDARSARLSWVPRKIER